MPSGPLVVPSLRLGHYSLGAFGPLNPIETLESASNYYTLCMLDHEGGAASFVVKLYIFK